MSVLGTLPVLWVFRAMELLAPSLMAHVNLLFLLPVEQNGASVIRRFPSRLSCALQIGLFTSWRIK